MKLKTILKIFILLLIIGVITVCLIYTGYIRFNYPSSKEYPIRGIDVSNHQKNIRWNEIDKGEVKFVFIKATEGGDFKDKRFRFNWNEAKKQGFDVGAYHFFTFCKSGKEQANNFIETVPVEKGSLPPLIDLEFGGNCKLNKSKDEILAEIDTIEQILFKHNEKKPIFYVTEDFYNKMLINNFKNSPIWFRDIYKKPITKDNRKWLFWQYGNRGNLKGIDTYVDLNVYNGTKEEYQKLIK